VKLYAYKNKCLDSFVAYVTVVEPLKPKLPADTIICPGGSVKLKSNIKAEAYKWSTGQTTDSIITKLEGWIYLDVYSKICYWRDSMKITIDRAIVNAQGDTTICSNDPINRDIYGAPGMAKYTWSTGATTRITNVKKTGKYYLIGETVNKCKSLDSVTVSQYSPGKVDVRDTTVCPSVLVTFDSKINTGGNTTVVWSDGASGRTSNISAPGLYCGSTGSILVAMCICVTAKHVYWPANEEHLCLRAHANAPLLSFTHWYCFGVWGGRRSLQ
jgi:hypothetical protein